MTGVSSIGAMPHVAEGHRSGTVLASIRRPAMAVYHVMDFRQNHKIATPNHVPVCMTKHPRKTTNSKSSLAFKPKFRYTLSKYLTILYDLAKLYICIESHSHPLLSSSLQSMEAGVAGQNTASAQKSAAEVLKVVYVGVPNRLHNTAAKIVQDNLYSRDPVTRAPAQVGIISFISTMIVQYSIKYNRLRRQIDR